MLDIGTYGNTPAAIKLVEIINEKNINSYPIGKLLCAFNTTLNELTKINSRIGIGLVKMVYMQSSEKAKKLNPEISSYVQNVLSTKYKLWIKERNGNIPYKVRKEWE